MEYNYEFFKNEILNMTGINLHFYKEKQMKRRINTLIERKNISGYREFIEMLKNDRNELDAFLDYITINVTNFFRTDEHWHYMEDNVLPELCRKKEGKLKVWSTACSTGEEPYSIVMSLNRYLPLESIHVLATDVDVKVLKLAEEGIFSEKSMEGVSEGRKVQYFQHTEKGYQISDAIKNCVEFRKMDILKEEYPKNNDLILCRNVLIYFTEEAKNEIYTKISNSLAEGGCLFTGNTEQLIQYKSFGLKKEKTFIYRK